MRTSIIGAVSIAACLAAHAQTYDIDITTSALRELPRPASPSRGGASQVQDERRAEQRATAGPSGTSRSRTGLYSRGGGPQDLLFCAWISDLQLAENLLMSIPALTQSFIS